MTERKIIEQAVVTPDGQAAAPTFRPPASSEPAHCFDPTYRRVK